MTVDGSGAAGLLLAWKGLKELREGLAEAHGVVEEALMEHKKREASRNRDG